MAVLLVFIGAVLIVGALKDNVGATLGALEEDILPPRGVASVLALMTVIWIGGRVLRLPAGAHALNILILAAIVFRAPDALKKAREQIEGASPGTPPSKISAGEASTVTGSEATVVPAEGGAAPASGAPPAGKSSNGIPFGLGGLLGGSSR